MSIPKIGIVISTTREGRFADKPAQWIFDLASKRNDIAFELVDLRDYPMPFFDAPKSPAYGPVDHEEARRWAAKVNELDGYLFITAEYNRSISGALKNALDHAYSEFNRKPAAFVGYGGVGAARAIEQLRLMCVELQIAPTRNAVHIGIEPYLGVLQQGKSFNDYEFLTQSAQTMLDDLSWWASTLKAGRSSSALAVAA